MKKPHIAIGIAAAVLSSALVAGIAESYTTFCLPGWPNQTGIYRDNSTSFPSSAGTVTAIRAALQAGADEWTNRGNSRFHWNYDGTSTQTSIMASDSRTVLFFANSTSGNALAVCVCRGSTVIGSDIRFYNWDWHTNGSDWDIRAVATHELGHALGLGHSGTSGATMQSFYFGIGGRSIEADDRAGILAIYGSSVPAPTIGSVNPPTSYQRGGDLVVVTGTNFQTGMTCTIGGQDAPVVSVDSSTTATVSVPPSTTLGARNVTVSNSAGSATLQNGLTYQVNPYEVLFWGGAAQPGTAMQLRITGPPNADWGVARSRGAGPYQATPSLTICLGPPEVTPVNLIAKSFGGGFAPNLDEFGVFDVHTTMYSDLPPGTQMHVQAVIKVGPTLTATNKLQITVQP